MSGGPSENREERSRNICLTIAYDGTEFHGWQRQPDRPTVQGCLETAIGKIVGNPVALWGSGRTDAGVHALNQVANFKTASPIPCPNLIKAINDLIAPTVRIKEAREVKDRFHARYDVRSKTYRYRILQTPICSPLLWRFVHHVPYALDRNRMARAAKLFEGEHDFTSFAAAEAELPDRARRGKSLAHESDCSRQPDSRRAAGQNSTCARSSRIPESRSMLRTIFSSRILWRPRTSMLTYEVRGDGFLHHMVRNMAGTLIEVGRGRLTPSDVVTILKARDRTKAGPTAPAKGLCLIRVEY